MDKLLNTSKFTILMAVVFATGVVTVSSQSFDSGRFSGSFQFEAQTYKQDSLMEAKKVNEQILSNGFFNLNYRNGGFSAGMRYEHYLNPLQGIDAKYKGQGIPYRFLSFSNDFIEATAGNFYEQFGSGMIFRAYEEKALGIDNSIEGARFRITPSSGISIVGIWGTQRNFWSQGTGIIRGGDLDLSINDIFNRDIIAGTNITAGASVISTYQADRDNFFYMPENVLAWSGRATFLGENYSVDAEYSHKFNNPNATNNYNYNDGYGFILNSAYFDKGISVSLNLHKIDNMDFRSDRYAKGTELMLNYIPPLTKQHSYRLATMYPFATQYNGQAGLQAEVTYKIPRNTKIGGKYGTVVTVNYSRIHSIDTTHIDEFKYDSPFFGIGNDLYFQDLNVTFQRRFSRDFRGAASYFNTIYDRDRMENEGVPNSGKVHAHIFAVEGTYRITNTYALKCEIQHQWATQDSAITSHDLINGNWLGMLAEFTISPGWFISFYNDWNYGNSDKGRQIHYINGNVAYSTGATRVSLGYGKQRAGILCVGGVCRQVPASNGVYVSISTSF